MGLRPKEDQLIRFRQSGESNIRDGKVVRILRPEFYKDIKQVRYVVESKDERLFIESHEMIEYIK